MVSKLVFDIFIQKVDRYGYSKGPLPFLTGKGNYPIRFQDGDFPVARKFEKQNIKKILTQLYYFIKKFDINMTNCVLECSKIYFCNRRRQACRSKT